MNLFVCDDSHHNLAYFTIPVSYTHLDVYKRQDLHNALVYTQTTLLPHKVYKAIGHRCCYLSLIHISTQGQPKTCPK